VVSDVGTPPPLGGGAKEGPVDPTLTKKHALPCGGGWLWTVPYPTKGLLVEYTQALELIVLKELGKMPQ